MGYKPGLYYLNAITNQLIWQPLVVVEEDPSFTTEPHVYNSWTVNFEGDYEKMIDEVDEMVTRKILTKERGRREISRVGEMY